MTGAPTIEPTPVPIKPVDGARGSDRHRAEPACSAVNTSPDGSAARPAAVTLGMGTATPTIVEKQDRLGEQLARAWGLSGAALKRWRRIIRHSQIETRAAVTPIETVPRLSTSERMRIYEREAPRLAVSAARKALDASGARPGQITDLVVVSCTGFSAPGVDVDLICELGLPHHVRRSTIGFMGCFGGVTGLRAAHATCAADPDALTLMVCVELCSLHLGAKPDIQNQIASALFADGAAAVVVSNASHAMCSAPNIEETSKNEMDPGGVDVVATRASPPVRRHVIRSPGLSRLFPERRDDMSWRVADAGFVMTLSPSVPATLEANLASLVRQSTPLPRTFAAHPGGAAIIDAAQRALTPFGAGGIDAARAVMRQHGNMSSASVLFVLDQLIKSAAPAPIMLVAFGPGLTIDTITLEEERLERSRETPATKRARRADPSDRVFSAR